MELQMRPRPYIMPTYSLTNDLISFLRCGLQYRYNVIGRLPPSNPVQMWFGQFIHGVLEEAYRRYLKNKDISKDPFPSLKEEIDDISNLILDHLAVQGLFPWNDHVKDIGIKRAQAAVLEMGPDLFPIIEQAEVRLTGTQRLPKINPDLMFREAERYEISGIVDVISHLQLKDQKNKENMIIKNILDSLNGPLPEKFEVIIDYKGIRRPAHKDNDFWETFDWQLQTYAHLRSRQPESLPIVGGVIIHVNELFPSQRDIEELKDEIRNQTTDILPSEELKEIILQWKNQKEVLELPYSFRLKRALRVVKINEESIKEALKEFDLVVKRIEECLGREKKSGDLFSSWEVVKPDRATCTACDAKTYCKESADKGLPKLPGIKRN